MTLHAEHIFSFAKFFMSDVFKHFKQVWCKKGSFLWVSVNKRPIACFSAIIKPASSSCFDSCTRNAWNLNSGFSCSQNIGASTRNNVSRRWIKYKRLDSTIACCLS